MQEFTLSLKIQTNASVTPEEAAKIVQRLIDAGLSDAADTIESGEGAVEEAQIATELTIHAPEVTKVPRVLVIVSGGMADTVQDSLLDVVVFDWDDYNADPEGTGGVPADFADLAEPCGIPVENDGDDVTDSAVSMDEWDGHNDNSLDEALEAAAKWEREEALKKSTSQLEG